MKCRCPSEDHHDNLTIIRNLKIYRHIRSKIQRPSFQVEVYKKAEREANKGNGKGTTK